MATGRTFFPFKNDEITSEEFQKQADQLLKELIDIEFEIQADIADLASCTGPNKVANEKNASIKEKMNQLHKKISEVEQFAQEQNNQRDTEFIITRLKRHRSEQTNLNNALRKANITCKQNMDKQHEKDRTTLFEGGENALKLRKTMTRKETLKANETLTETLHRITNRMANETERAGDILGELARSSQRIEETMDEHRNISTSIRTGRSILTRLRRREFTDQMLIWFGVAFFLAVVLYIVKERLGITFFS